MRCLNCNNIKDFTVLGNQNIGVKIINGQIKKVRKNDFTLSDIFPVICRKCQSENIDFKYWEIKEILTKSKSFRASNEI